MRVFSISAPDWAKFLSALDRPVVHKPRLEALFTEPSIFEAETVLSDADYIAVRDALNSPRTPNADLQWAATRPRRFIRNNAQQTPD